MGIFGLHLLTFKTKQLYYTKKWNSEKNKVFKHQKIVSDNCFNYCLIAKMLLILFSVSDVFKFEMCLEFFLLRRIFNQRQQNHHELHLVPKIDLAMATGKGTPFLVRFLNYTTLTCCVPHFSCLDFLASSAMRHEWVKFLNKKQKIWFLQNLCNLSFFGKNYLTFVMIHFL